jgi:hypothetical protein
MRVILIILAILSFLLVVFQADVLDPTRLVALGLALLAASHLPLPDGLR